MKGATACCTFRVYEELNDFLPADRRKTEFRHRFSGTPSVKDTIEALGIPHTEVDLILVDGASVDFSFRLTGGERVAVYPVFERLDITGATKLRPEPLRDPRFVLDVHLGKLARYLRLVGFDSLYRNDYHDERIIRLSRDEQRIILTRDVGILKHGAVTHGHWLRSTAPREQLREVVCAFHLEDHLRPFSRCMECNGRLVPVDRRTVRDRIPHGVARRHQDFSACESCNRIYWRGSHYERLTRLVEDLLENWSSSGQPGTG